MIFFEWVKLGGQVGGKAWDKYLSDGGKEEYLELSPKIASCSQSYPQYCPRLLQRFIHESTTTTTTTIFIKIY